MGGPQLLDLGDGGLVNVGEGSAAVFGQGAVHLVGRVGIAEVAHHQLVDYRLLGNGRRGGRRRAIFQKGRNQSRPPRLMVGPESLAGVAVEVFVEENLIRPARLVKQ